MEKKHVHYMGIGGQGISALAQMAFVNGDLVTGCDRALSATTREMQEKGIPVQIGHHADHLADVDTLVICPAVLVLDAQNPELLAAQERGIPIITWQEMLGRSLRGKCLLSVSGVHGKSTTTSMLSLLLTDAGLDPTCVIGAVVPRFGANYRLGESDYVVNEADEYYHNFWHYHPRLAIVTSIEFEHPEFFPDYEAFLAAFERFIRGMDQDGNWPLPPTLLFNASNPGCLELLARLQDWPGRILTYAIEGTSLLPDSPTFEAYDLKLDGETSFRIRLNNTDLRSRPLFSNVPDLSDLSRGPDPLLARLSSSNVPDLSDLSRGPDPTLPHSSSSIPNEPIHLRLPGVYNIENALAALAAAHCVGVPAETMIQTLGHFGGSRRRFDIQHQGPLNVGGRQLEDVMLVDDYAHHPTAIAATLEGARRRYPGRRLIAVYQPHMFSRTKTFFDQFLQSFDAADVAIIADIFPARERDTGLIHSRKLVAALALRPHFTQGTAQLYHGGSVAETTQLLSNILRSGDLAIIMGAGDIYLVTDQLLS